MSLGAFDWLPVWVEYRLSEISGRTSFLLADRRGALMLIVDSIPKVALSIVTLRTVWIILILLIL